MGLDILLFLLLGLFVGTFGTLVGIGGGLICVPIFIFFLSDGGVYAPMRSRGHLPTSVKNASTSPQQSLLLLRHCPARFSAHTSSTTSRVRCSTYPMAHSFCLWLL